MTSLGNYAFNRCTVLKGALNLQYVTSIGTYVFEVCSALEGITFSSNLTSIGTMCFNWCTSITGDIEVPASVTTVGNVAFRGTAITSLTFLGDSTVITPGYWSTGGAVGYRTLR